MTPESRIVFDAVIITTLTMTVTFRFLIRYVFYGRPTFISFKDVFCETAIVLGSILSFIVLGLDIRAKIWTIQTRDEPILVPVLAVPPRLAEAVLKEILFDEFAYVTILWVVKTCFLSMYINLLSALPKYIRYYIKFTALYTFTTFVVITTTLAVWCRPISLAWSLGPDQCTVSSTMDFPNLTFGLHISTDVFILGVAILILHSIQLGRREKMAIAFVASIGSLTMIAAVLRYYFAYQLVNKRNAEGTSIKVLPAKIFVASVIECQIALLAASLPAFKVMIRKWIESSASRNRSSGHETRGVVDVYSKGSRVRKTSRQDAYPLDDRSSTELEAGEGSYRAYVSVGR